MAKVQHTCTGCVPIDASIIDVYVTLVQTNQFVTDAETGRALAEAARVTAENARKATFSEDHSRAVTDHTNAQTAINNANAAAAAASAAGITSASASVDSNVGTPSVDVSLVNKQLSLSFHNIKGEKGEKGDRGDGAIPVVNDLVTGGTNAALSAEMGKTLNTTKQATLVSGTNIKTVNGESLLGEGNIVAGDPNAVKYVAQTLTDAQKAQARTNIDSYQKPSTGIPATDLASAAQTSLGKADTAYQKPSGGIPKTDLDSGVQGSLDLADSAIQARPMGEVDPTITPADYATTEELSELEAKVTNVFVGADNSTNVAINTQGVVNDSNITVTTDFMELKTISVPINVSGELPAGKYIGARIVFFNENKVAIDYWGSYTGNVMPKTYTAPAGSKYVRLSIRLIDSSTSEESVITPASVESYKVNFPAKTIPTYNEFLEVKQVADSVNTKVFSYPLTSKNTELLVMQTDYSMNTSDITVISNYIKVKGNQITFNVGGTVSGTIAFRIFYFDANKTPFDWQGSYGNNTLSKTFTPPANTAFVRICLRNLVNGTAQTLSETSIDSWGVSCDGINMADSDDIVGVSGFSDDIISLNDRRFYAPAIANLKRARRSVSGVVETPAPLVLLQFTDLHGNAHNLARLARFKSSVGGNIDGVVCLGDSVYNTIADTFAFWSASEYAGFLNTIGNHDAASAGNLAPRMDVYEKFIAPFVSAWGVVQPDGASANGYCYYYKDFSANAIRLIVCDSMYWDNTQKSWLDSVLEDAITSELSVIIAQHYPLSSLQANFIDCSFTSIKVENGIGDGMPDEILASVDSFISAGGKFICHINGHTHCDMISYSKNTVHKQLSITTDTATNELPQWNDGDRTTGTKSQDAFNIVGYDTFSKTIRIVKVGKNLNQALQNAIYITIKYDETGVSMPEILNQS